ncbi:MAG TPA: hypothetical protein VN950_22810 [Terriglobales bacterium]|nr:hypothetical protein [Terriglobales bacterium]
MRTFQRLCLLVILVNLLVFALGCTANWIGEASSILQTLIPAAAALLGLLGTLGVGPAVLAAFTAWSTKATTSLNIVGQLVQDYNKAEATAQPGILGQIDSAITAVLDELQPLLPTLNVKDPKTQSTITGLFADWAQELEALLNLIPVIKGSLTPVPADAVTEHEEVMKRLNKLKSAKQFKKELNAKIATVNPKFQVK